MMTYDQYVTQMETGDLFVIALAVIGLIFAFVANRLQSGWTLKISHVMVLAFFARVPMMFESLWYDETFSGVASALIPNPTAFNTFWMSDVHPPLAYWLYPFRGEGIWGDVLLRVVPLLAGLWVVYLVYLICKVMYRKSYRVDEIAIIASLLVALSPALIQYSAEARAYMPMTSLVLVGVLAILKNKPFWFGFIVFLPLINNHGYLWMGLLCLIAILYAKSKRVEWVASLLVIVLVSANAFFNFLLPQMTDVTNGFWLRGVTIGSFLSSFVTITIGARMPIGIMILVSVMVFGLIIASYRAQNRNYILWVMVVGVPLITAIISVFWSPIYLPRAMLPASVFVLIGMANLASESKFNRGLVFGVLAIPFFFQYAPDYQKMDNRTFLDNCAGTDVIYSPATNVAIISKWYSDLPVMVAPNHNDLNQWLSDSALDVIGISPVEWDDIQGQFVCVPFLVNPMIGEAQRAFKRDLDLMVSQGNAQRFLMESSAYLDFYIYKVWKYDI